MKEDEIYKACSMHWRDQKHKISWSENWNGRSHLGDQGIIGRIILTLVLFCIVSVAFEIQNYIMGRG
jgi:hypothetical protein